MEFLNKKVDLKYINKNIIGVSQHNFVTDKTKRDYKIINMADFHDVTSLSKRKQKVILDYLSANKDISFITITGDLATPRLLMDDDYIMSLAQIFNEYSLLSNHCPIFIILGNHDVGLFKKVNIDAIMKSFKRLQSDNIYPLIEEFISFDDDVSIYGHLADYERISVNDDSYYARLMFKVLKQYEDKLDSNKLNIALIHNNMASYNLRYNPRINDIAFNLILAGHAHGGYRLPKTLLDDNFDGIGYSENTSFPFIKKVCGVSGVYKLGDDTFLSVTEGINRFHGYIPSIIDTIPFVSEVNIKKKVLK